MILYLIKQPKAFDFVWSLIEFADASLKNSELMYFAVVPAGLLLEKVPLKALGLKIACNAVSVSAVRFGNAVLNTLVLGKIAVSMGDVKLRMRCP